MTDLTMWSLLIGALLPPFISIVQQPSWTTPLRTTVTAVTCLFVGTGTSYFTHEFSGRSVTSSILVVLVAAWAAYGHFWKPIGASPAIEHATSPSSELKTVPPASEDV